MFLSNDQVYSHPVRMILTWKSSFPFPDWFDIRYRELEGQPAPRSMFGPFVDSLQENVHAYLEGKMNETTGMVERTTFSQLGRLAFLSLIIANVIAVVIESIPEADKYVGNQKGNAFDVFEVISVAFFTIGESSLNVLPAPPSLVSLTKPNASFQMKNMFFVFFLLEKAEAHFTRHSFMQLLSLVS